MLARPSGKVGWKEGKKQGSEECKILGTWIYYAHRLRRCKGALLFPIPILILWWEGCIRTILWHYHWKGFTLVETQIYVYIYILHSINIGMRF
jgi:hypothetical protein